MSDEPVLTDEAKRQIFGRRIAELEAEVLNYKLSMVEMKALLDLMDGVEKTDAKTGYEQAELGYNASKIRLTALRAEYSKQFPVLASPASPSPTE